MIRSADLLELADTKMSAKAMATVLRLLVRVAEGVQDEDLPARRNNAERQARWRARQAANEGVIDGVTDDVTGDVTHNVTHNVTDQERVPFPSSSLSPTPPILTTSLSSHKIQRGKNLKKARVSAKERRFRRDDWPELPADWRACALENGMTDKAAETAFTLFSNYWTARASRSGVKRDWPAMWENWVIERLEAQPVPALTEVKPAPPAGPLAPDARRAAVRAYVKHGTWISGWGEYPGSSEVAAAREKLKAEGWTG